MRLQASYFIFLVSVPQTLTNTILLPHLTPPWCPLYLIFLFETLGLACNFSSAYSCARGAQISLDYSKHYQSRDNKNGLVMMFKYMLKNPEQPPRLVMSSLLQTYRKNSALSWCLRPLHFQYLPY